MELSEQALMLLVESVWAVSARRAFEKGCSVGADYGRPSPLCPSPHADVLAFSENAHNAAMVLVRDEVIKRLDALRERLQSRHDSSSDDTSYGKSQRATLRWVLEQLQAVAAVDPVVPLTTTK